MLRAWGDPTARMRHTLRDLAEVAPRFTGAAGVPAAGFKVLHESIVLADTAGRFGNADAAFDKARAGLLTWQMHRGARLRVEATQDYAVVGALVVQGVRLGPVTLLAPCRVTAVWDETTEAGTRRAGFEYVALPGHPEIGAERFELECADGRTTFVIKATSHTSLGLAGAHLVSDRVQTMFIKRYLRSMRQLGRAAGDQGR